MQKALLRKTPPFCSALDLCLLHSFQLSKLGFVPALIEKVKTTGVFLTGFAVELDAQTLRPVLAAPPFFSQIQ